MTEAEALARLENMIQASEDPVLSAEELGDLIKLAKREDSEGRAIDHDDWVETWNLAAAAAEGWRWKAGKSVPRFNVNVDGASLARAQIYAHCLRQAERYAAKVIGSMGVRSSVSGYLTTT